VLIGGAALAMALAQTPFWDAIALWLLD
jgi:hypothetical protein